MGWGPENRKAAIAISFDNFGEAFDVEQGIWPEDAELGTHYTATRVLPDLLTDLAKHGLTATFFVEGWNAGINPRSLKAMQSAGHEVGLHGWRHELWFAQSSAERAAILERSVAAMRALGITPVGFRPPGGRSTDDTGSALKEAGFRYLSAAGEGVTTHGEVADVPFRWVDVDALYLEPRLGVVRNALFGSERLLSLADWKSALEKVVEEALERETCYTLIFHPYLLGEDPDRYAVFTDFLGQLAKHGDIWAASCAQVADWASN